MKKTLLMIITFLLTVNLFSQEVEKLCVLEEVKLKEYKAGQGDFPQRIYYDEIEHDT